MGKGVGGTLNKLTEIFSNNSRENCIIKKIAFYRVDDILSLTLNGGAKATQADLFYIYPDRDYNFRFKEGNEVDILIKNRNSERDWSELVGLLNWFDNFKIDKYLKGSAPKEVYIQEAEGDGN